MPLADRLAIVRALLAKGTKVPTTLDGGGWTSARSYTLHSWVHVPEMLELLLAAGLRYRLLSARDRGDFAAALELAAQDRELEGLYGPWLRELTRIVSALEGEGAWPDPALTGIDLVDELRDGAGRAAARGRYDEAAERLVAACRVLARLRLRRLYGHAGGGAGGLWTDYERLQELGDSLGRYFAAHRDELRALVDPWRKRLWRCGAASSDRESWTAAARRWGAWLDEAQEIL